MQRWHSDMMDRSWHHVLRSLHSASSTEQHLLPLAVIRHEVTSSAVLQNASTGGFSIAFFVSPFLLLADLALSVGWGFALKA